MRGVARHIGAMRRELGTEGVGNGHHAPRCIMRRGRQASLATSDEPLVKCNGFSGRRTGRDGTTALQKRQGRLVGLGARWQEPILADVWMKVHRRITSRRSSRSRMVIPISI